MMSSSVILHKDSLYRSFCLVQRMCETERVTERVKSGLLHVAFLFGAFPLALFILLSQAAQSCTQDRLHASSNPQCFLLGRPHVLAVR